MKRWFLMVTMALLAFVLAGCGGTQTQPPAAPKPVAEAPEAVCKKILEYQSYQQWQQVYKYQHPDYQALVTEQEFVDMKSENILAINSIEVKDAITLDSWTDKDGTEKTYANVAEVPFSLKVNILGKDQDYKGSMHFAKDSGGLWKGFSDLPEIKKKK